jgi:hypothetical protein
LYGLRFGQEAGTPPQAARAWRRLNDGQKKEDGGDGKSAVAPHPMCLGKTIRQDSNLSAAAGAGGAARRAGAGLGHSEAEPGQGLEQSGGQAAQEFVLEVVGPSRYAKASPHGNPP